MREGTYAFTPIWGDVIPGNCERSKLDDMKIDYDIEYQKNQIRFALLIGKYSGKLNFDRQKVVDTTTWLNSIKPGIVEETYTDVPGIVPFLKEGADRAVIVIPGGGFTFSTDPTAANQEETDKLAKKLNDRGISAFVLDYRFNPYKFPIPLLDLQRAIRFIRFHAKEYRLDPNKIAIMGGSAGGYMVAAHLNLAQGQDLFPEGYVPDAIDAVDDHVANGGMFYPAISLNWNIGCLYSTAPRDVIKDRKRRNEFLARADLPNHISDAKTPLFLAHGTKDMLVSHKGSRLFVKKYRKAGGDIRYVEVEGANHIFTNKPEFLYAYDEYLTWLDKHF